MPPDLFTDAIPSETIFVSSITDWLNAPAEALRYAVENLRTPKAFGAWLEVGDERFNSGEIQRLYEAADYPLRKPE